jgi:hypothetical protein
MIKNLSAFPPAVDWHGCQTRRHNLGKNIHYGCLEAKNYGEYLDLDGFQDHTYEQHKKITERVRT